MIGLENPLHIAMILVVVLLVFGAKRLPEMASRWAKGCAASSSRSPAQRRPPRSTEWIRRPGCHREGRELRSGGA